MCGDFLCVMDAFRGPGIWVKNSREKQNKELGTRECIMAELLEWIFPQKKQRYVGFEDVLYAISHPTQFIIINTLANGEQEYLIKNTVDATHEEEEVMRLLNDVVAADKKVIVYGRNAIDDSVEKKMRQLLNLGIGEVWIYRGGLFEWCLLHEVYGEEFGFSGGRIPRDILKYRPGVVIR